MFRRHCFVNNLKMYNKGGYLIINLFLSIYYLVSINQYVDKVGKNLRSYFIHFVESLVLFGWIEVLKSPSLSLMIF